MTHRDMSMYHNGLLPWHQSQWDKLAIAREYGHMPHALLVAGPVGLGKLEFTRLFANSLVCGSVDAQGLPCGMCRQCKLVAAGSHPDITGVTSEEAGKAIKVDAIRKLVDQSILSVNEFRYRVFIIQPAEAMGVAAANALLKTLEEPVDRTLLILISAYPSQLLATIKSRCQRLMFSPPSAALALDWLAAEVGLDPSDPSRASDLLRLAKGAPLLASQMAKSDELQQYGQLLNDFLLLADSKAEPVAVAAQWHNQQDMKVLLNYMKRWLMDLVRLGNGAGAMDGNSTLPLVGLKILANQLDLTTVYKLLDSLFETERWLVNNINPQLALEQILLHWVFINRKRVT